MKKNAMLVLGSAACMLISCGNMPSITPDRAKELAKEIINRQDDSQVFTEPNNFVYKNNSRLFSEELTPSGGKTQFDDTSEEIFMIDVDKLVSRHYWKSVSTAEGTSEHEEIDFYDAGAGTIYYLSNDNGYKTRKEDHPATLEDAQSYFNDYRDAYERTYKWRSEGGQHMFALDEFSSHLDSALALHEELKNESDQYCNVHVGSDNAKSLQAKCEIKFKDEQIGYEGYSIANYNCVIRNDLFEKSTTNSSYDRKWKNDQRFYKKGETNIESSMSYGNAKIGIPNPNDYVLVEK